MAGCVSACETMTAPLQTVRCPACATVQTVPAPSPRGFALHLRCHGCRQPLEGDDVTRLGAGLEVPAGPVGRGWSVFVEGEVVGDLSEEEIRRYHRAEVIEADALVWHAGFRGWARLSETATFREMAGGRRSTPRHPAAVVDLTDELDPRDAGSEPVVTGDTVVAAVQPEGSAEISMIAQAATAGIYPIPRSGARLISMLVAVGVVVGMATAGGVSLVAASL